MNHIILNIRVYRISTVSKVETTTRYRAVNEQRTHLMGIILFSFSDFTAIMTILMDFKPNY